MSDVSYPAEWAELQPEPVVHRHFAADLPPDWNDIFEKVMQDVFAILGGGFEFYCCATHTHMRLPSSDANRVLNEVAPLLGNLSQSPGDYTSFSRVRAARVVFLQYDTISEAHRRSVIAHEYMHVHQVMARAALSTLSITFRFVFSVALK